MQFGIAGFWICVRQEEEVVDTVEFLTVDTGGGRQLKHAFKTDGWFLSGAITFADKSGPHGVVQFRCGI
jgi:hypothetical protein